MDTIKNGKKGKMLSYSERHVGSSMVAVPSLKVCKKICRAPKKRAFFPSFCLVGCVKGSMAIEGSLVLPCFLLFMMTVLMSLEAVRFQSDMAQALYLTGNKMAVLAYREKYEGKAQVNAEAEIKAYLGSQFLPYLCVENKERGVILQDVSAFESGKVEIRAQYRLAPVIWWLPVGDVVVKDRFLGHAWTGYCGGEGGWTDREVEIYVYITKTGTKYHMSEMCSHLKIQIKAINALQIEESRNQWGSKYTPCGRCDAADTGIVYITTDGRNYHGSGNCSALKRTVYLVPLGEAGGYSPCSRCGR